MIYNFRLFWRMAYRSFFKQRGTHGQINRKRLIFILIFYTIWPLWTLITWFCFLLDDLVWPGHKTQKVEKPLFLLGNFRSGSTFLHRLLAQDKTTFTTLRTWDIFLTPTITQRKIARLAARIDAFFGKPLLRLFVKFDRRSLGSVHIHPISFFSPEEDENILLFNFSTYFVGFLFPFMEEMPPYTFFDDQLPEKERHEIMSFYRSCVQRHLYAHGGDVCFLSKNPSFSAKVATVKAFFPDARILYLTRNPLEMLPSTISWLGYVWHIFGEPLEKYPHRAEILEFTQYWYRHALKYLDEHPSPNHLILEYNDLFKDPQGVIFDFCHRFGYPITSRLEQAVARAVMNNHLYNSDHQYSYEEMGFTREQIVNAYEDIFKRFGYST